MGEEIVEKELSYEIMNAAFAVHNALGPGFLESIYESAMAHELVDRGHQVETQVRISVFYKDTKIGEHVLDMVVDGKIILELKAVTEIAQIHIQQARSYVKATNLHLAIVINFGSSRVQSERVANTRENHSRNSNIRPIRDNNYS
jgi:GxxExxY protein